LTALLAAWSLVRSAEAQVTGVLGSDTTAYFGSQNDAYQASNPAGLNPWPPAGPNPPAYYASITQLPGVPAPPAGNVAPSNVTPFSPTAASSSFNDGYYDTATSSILGSVTYSSLTVNDALVSLPAGGMTLNESVGLYDYEQVNYDIDFSVANYVNITGVAGALGGLVTRSYNVSGLVGTGPGAFVAFGGEMNFWDATTNTSLGALTFNYFNNVGGAYSTTVTSSGTINAIYSPDVLRITGDFFLIGDPSSIQVQSVPEPSTWILLAIGIGPLWWARRRHRSA
jgi:hypothetical protein